MIAALSIFLMSLLPPTTSVVYDDLPADVSEARVYEWRGDGPRLIETTARQPDGSVVARASQGQMVVVMLRRADGAYLLDGPAVWPERHERRRVDAVWRRSDEGAVPRGLGPGAAADWLRADNLRGAWPYCFRQNDRWECWGLQPGNRGVVVLSGTRLAWGVMDPVARGPLRLADWARLLIVGDSSPAVTDLKIVCAHPVAPPIQRLNALRLETAVVPGASVARVAPGVVWVSGDALPAQAWLDVRSAAGGPAFLPLQDVASASYLLPLHVRLQDRRIVSGVITTRDGRPAGGALVSVFRPIERPPPDSRFKPRRVFAAEVIANADGTFEVDGLGDADYEIVAWHSQLGRASASLDATKTDVTIRLASTGEIRGRVMAEGKPVRGVAVISVPDAATFNGSADMTEAKGGDATTGADGRFSVSAAVSGGGELRIGGGTYAVKRVPLPRVPVPELDLGDVELGGAIEIVAVLERDPRCVVQAIGPMGRTGLQVISGTTDSGGVHRLRLPEPGLWQFGLVCGEARRALAPSAVEIGAAHSGQEVAFRVR